MPEVRTRALLKQEVLHPSHSAKAGNGELQPFRYLMFNSFLEPRKSLLFAIKAYRLAGLADHDHRAHHCVTSQLKRMLTENT